MIFSSPEIAENAENVPFFHTPGKDSFVGKMCPSIIHIHGNNIQDNEASFKYNYRHFDTIDWAEEHSLSITEFAKAYNISENDIPCLFIYDVTFLNYCIIPLNGKVSLYFLFKHLKVLVEEYCHSYDEFIETQSYSFTCKYLKIQRELNEIANSNNKELGEAVTDVLNGRRDYKSVKSIICDNKIRNDIKRIGQWQRHFPKEIENIKKLEKLSLDFMRRVSQLSDNLFFQKESKFGKPISLILLDHIYSACLLLQGNSLLISKGNENDRNTYLRDLLKQHDIYTVLDQTLNGKSLEGVEAGELDLRIDSKEGTPISIIEGMNLKSVSKTTIGSHIDKIFSYDTAGLEANYLISFVKTSNFSSFVAKYINFVSKYNYSLEFVDFAECENNNKYTEIRLFETLLERSGRKTKLIHILVHLH